MIRKTVPTIFSLVYLLLGHGPECLSQDAQDTPEIQDVRSSDEVYLPHDVGIPQQANEDWPVDLDLYDQKGDPKKQLQSKEDPGSITNLDDIDFESIDKLKTHEKNFVPIIKIEQEKRIGFKWPTEIYRAVLKANSIVYDIHTNKGLLIYRKAFVFAQEETAGGDNIFIYDKLKRKRYKTHSGNVISIEEDVSLQTTPSTYKEYDPPTQYHTKDTRFLLNNYIDLHGEITRDQYFADLFTSLLPAGKTPDSDTFYAYGRRLEYKVFYMWDFPIQFGIDLNYQEGSWIGDASDWNWKSVFFGPVAQYTFYRSETIQLNMHLSFQQSFYFKAVSKTQNYFFNYSTNAMEVDFNSIWPTTYGRFVIGLGLRRAKASLKESSLELRRNPERGSLDSGSVFLGYNFDWNVGG